MAAEILGTMRKLYPTQGPVESLFIFRMFRIIPRKSSIPENPGSQRPGDSQMFDEIVPRWTIKD